MIFTPESKLLIENWDTVQDIFESEMRLRQELRGILTSLRSELEKYDWWKDGWIFKEYKEDQIYISNKSWMIEDQYIIWIGVEGFNPKQIFGIAASPGLYVWIKDAGSNEICGNLVKMLGDKLRTQQTIVIGQIDDTQNGYVIRGIVSRFIPEDNLEEFEKLAKQQIIDFFDFYAKTLRGYDNLIKPILAKN